LTYFPVKINPKPIKTPPKKSSLAKRPESREDFCFWINRDKARKLLKHISEKNPKHFHGKLLNQVRG